MISNNKTVVTKIVRNPNKNIKKSVTTYSNKLDNKKFNSNKFNEYLKSLKEYEIKKKEKLEFLRQQNEEKEKRKMTNLPRINKETKYNNKINPKNYSTVERLYTQDIIKRKEKKQILTKIYTPSFKPFVYTTNHIKNRLNQRNQNIRTDINEEENNYMFEDNEDTNDEFSEEISRKRNMSVEKRIRNRIEEQENNNMIDNKKIENKLRNFLFKNKKKSNKRNRSFEKAKKTKFNLD